MRGRDRNLTNNINIYMSEVKVELSTRHFMENHTLLQEDESLEDLQLKGLVIIQKKKGFRFGVDAVLLSHFSSIRKGSRVMDLCTGTGIVPVLLAGKTEASEICGLEIQEDFASMAKRTIKINSLQDRISIIEGDLKDHKLLKGMGLFDAVTVNPPYKKRHSGIRNPEDSLAIARHEVALELEDVILASKMLLKDGGRLFMVHRPERIADILELMRKHKIEPKRIQTVHPSFGKAPNIVLVEGQKYGGEFLKWAEPIYVYSENGGYSDQIREIYGDDRR